MPKPSRSPFYFYATEYRNRQCSRGQRMNINEAINACYDDWKALSEIDKEPYKNQYEEWRIQYRVNPESVNTSNQHTNRKKEISNEKILNDRDIPCEELKRHYDRFSLERNFLACEYLPLDKSELLSMPIYIINFQIFCKVDEEDGGQFIPAEMCILRYTLNDGVTVYRHKFIKPEQIPMGYMSSCLEHAKETHEIPIRDFCEATENYKLIYQELKSFLFPTIINQANNTLDDDDRTRRRYLRLTRPCIFYPAIEYEQTIKIIDWLQEKAEGRKPTNDTRFVTLASIESLVMVLAKLRKQEVSRDDMNKTFQNASYSFLIEERCPYHFQLGISHCSVARCHAAAKLISAYLNQLYVPEKPIITPVMTDKSSPFSHTSQSLSNSRSNSSIGRHQSISTRLRTTPQQLISNQCNYVETADSLASSYYPPEQKNHNNEQVKKLQQQNFHRLLSNAQSMPLSDNNPIDNPQRTILNQRKQILLQALQNIDQQIEELSTE
ncbi:unnamed protein product [Adineta steineri]|uniref:HMG box domain-containing protein n=1 Tax=Adineta steineri TaxID=433720 RepID=A0A814MTM8_9BILA|nr:unnamed protein product [Adineta steineri]